jgi:uncharacterized protein YutE (UPF0331/DUF86 family)
LDSFSVQRKLGIIQEALHRLSQTARIELSAYVVSFDERKIAERLLQESIEAAIDINANVVVEEGRPAPPDYYSSFGRAAEVGLMPADLALNLAPLSGLRNRLVHEYDVLDDQLVHRAVQDAVRLFPAYVLAVDAYLRRLGT